MPTTLITGGAGFIGRHVAEELLSRGHDVRLFDAFVPQVHGDPVRLPDGAQLVRGDVRDRDALDGALKGVDGVIHLAAEVGVGQSMYEVARYVGANDLGTAVLLEAIAAADVGRIVVASSMSIYGEGRYRDAQGAPVAAGLRRSADLKRGDWEVRGPDGQPLTPEPTAEDKQPDLASIYALTKYAQERAVLIFADAYGMNATALRLFNVFGAGQALSNPYTGVLANFASRVAKGERPTVFEDGRQRRDFVHVRDVATAFAQALEADESGRALNIGSGRSYSILDVARMVSEALGRPDLEPEVTGRFRAGDIRNCFADISAAEAALGFRPTRRLEDSLTEFAQWVEAETFTDNGGRMRAELEARGLVS
ncbi:NAD-dependent epimerase/dehydratase family protein [Wenxinia marina]|uniref:UDP-glucose 4-epimerase n=1 Tax=Wenxinia marina DSM 24838 TaxID=1123501 RepID=A0A0D0P953_9RHOB|nr:NAD-dependent epimerase/dehydratase family protein [Wenxinia marina]KIQ68096.1 UDP-glucose 4-epimerase [Wenxinia marina DSM 24838]GGL78187.1 nucleoside-diphosphate-sugar epimerase [Wenxinia marina]